MEAANFNPQRQPGDSGETSQTWQVLEEFLLPSEGSKEELANYTARVTESALKNLQLPESQLEILKSVVAQATLSACRPGPVSTSPGSAEGTPQKGLPILFRILISGRTRLNRTIEGLPSSQAWGYFLVEKRGTADLQANPGIDLFLYLEGSA